MFISLDFFGLGGGGGGMDLCLPLIYNNISQFEFLCGIHRKIPEKKSKM